MSVTAEKTAAASTAVNVGEDIEKEEEERDDCKEDGDFNEDKVKCLLDNLLPHIIVICCLPSPCRMMIRSHKSKC